MATSRRVVPLAAMVEAYIAQKSTFDPLKKAVDAAAKKIKERMLSDKVDEVEVNGKRAYITVVEKTEFNDDKAIEILRETLEPELFARCVKTKEYLDEDELNSLIYDKTIDAAILAPCTTPKDPVVTLRIGKTKEDK